MSAAEKWVTTQKLEAVKTEQEGEGGVNWLSDCLEENWRGEIREEARMRMKDRSVGGQRFEGVRKQTKT